MAGAYYDQKLTKEAAKKVISQAGGKHSPERSKPGIVVYKLRGEGEAMVEAAEGGKVRVRLFQGKCVC